VRARDRYHEGIVVEDYEATLERLSALFGYRWCDEMDVTIPVWLPDGVRDLNLRFTYSREEPRLEIIRVLLGTPWVPVEGGAVHHMGYWTDDIEADSRELEAEGYVREAAGALDDGPPIFVYYTRRDAPRVELVRSSGRAGMEAYWATGGFG
jgi:hypothetical protein